MISELKKIRELFREFCGIIPVRELAFNQILAKQIAEIEAQLRKLLNDGTCT